jgi:cyanobactin maturation PatA/PatG family protease
MAGAQVARQTSTQVDASISGLEELWDETLGDPSICVAILDGQVNLFHPCFVNANLTTLGCLGGQDTSEAAIQHGTHVASVIFGQHGGPVKGIAPKCRGLFVPIYANDRPGQGPRCSQIELARALSGAVTAGADFINISGGEFSPSGTAHPLLADAVKHCADRGVLIIAAAGNQGCECLQLPGALPSVLAVGAMDAGGNPLEFSNWGGPYQTSGILAPGENIRGAEPGGGIVERSGTSYATPIVAGVAALLLHLARRRGLTMTPMGIRDTILLSALGCEHQAAADCRRLLAGRLNVKGACYRT